MTAHFRDRRSFVLLAIIPAIALALGAQVTPDWIANYNSGVDALNAAHYTEAMRFLDAAAIQAREFPPHDARRLRTTPALAMACQYSGALDRAEALFMESRNTLDASKPEEQAVLAFTLDGLSQLRYEQGKWFETEELLKPAYTHCVQSSGPHSLCAVTVLRHLGESYATLTKSTEAEKALQEAIDIFRQTPALPKAALTSTLRSLASVYMLEGRASLAKPLFEESLDLSEKAQDLPAMGDSLLGLARMYRLLHNPARALPLLNKAVHLYETADDVSLPTALHELGLLSNDEGKFAMAKQYLERATALILRSRGPGNIALAYIHVGLATAYLGERNYNAAANHIQKAIEQERALLPGPHGELARAYLVAAVIEERRHQNSAADGHYRQALEIYHSSSTSDSLDVKKAEELYARFAKGYRK